MLKLVKSRACEDFEDVYLKYILMNKLISCSKLQYATIGWL